MKLFIKILLFVSATLITNVKVVGATITFTDISETTSSSFHGEIQKTVVRIIENDLADCCQNEQDLVTYREWGTGVEGVTAKGGMNLLKPLGLGSTGRTTASNLTEQLAMKEIMSNPTIGRTVMTGMKDSRWLGWNKMQYTHTALDGTKTTIHYVGKFKNGVLKAVDDFKFK